MFKLIDINIKKESFYLQIWEKYWLLLISGLIVGLIGTFLYGLVGVFVGISIISGLIIYDYY